MSMKMDENKVLLYFMCFIAICAITCGIAYKEDPGTALICAGIMIFTFLIFVGDL